LAEGDSKKKEENSIDP